MRTNWESQEEPELSADIQALFRAYRETLPDFDGGPEFMPKLWHKIESQRKVTYSFWRLGSGFVTASVALSLAFAFVLWTPLQSQGAANLNSDRTYVEVLADDTADDISDSATI